jgi:hypothetical protein
MQLLVILIWLSAIFVIFFAFYKALTLKRKISGGLVKQSWKLLYYLIGETSMHPSGMGIAFKEIKDDAKMALRNFIKTCGACLKTS